MAKTILRFEGLVVFIGCLYFYSRLDTSWLLFISLWLLPDISMIGYLKNKQVGATMYNVIHNYVLALFVILLGQWLDSNLITSLGVILTSHVGLDRFLGFGLKYPSGFKDTHIQK